MTIRPVVTTLVVAVVTGCASVQPLWQPERFIAERTPEVVYVTTRTQRVTAVAQPRVVGDTLYGVTDASHEVAIPLSEVGVAARRLNVGRTVMLVVGITGFTGMAAVALAGGGHDTGWYCDYSSDVREQNGGAPLCGYR